MSHLVAYTGNDPEHLGCALFQTRLALYWNQPGDREHPEGWGLGFVQGPEVLLQKRPRPGSHEVDFYALARDLRADSLIGRVGLSQDGRVAAEDADPFRFRSWLFASVGALNGFERVRDRVLSSIPEFLRRNIRGHSASEHLFHLFLAFLHDASIVEAHNPDLALVQRALHESLAFCEGMLSAAGETPGPLAVIATNGRLLIAESNRDSVRYLAIDGIADCGSPTCPDRERVDVERRRITHDSLRGLVVEADPGSAPRAGWHVVPRGSSLVVGMDRAPRVQANA